MVVQIQVGLTGPPPRGGPKRATKFSQLHLLPSSVEGGPKWPKMGVFGPPPGGPKMAKIGGFWGPRTPPRGGSGGPRIPARAPPGGARTGAFWGVPGDPPPGPPRGGLEGGPRGAPKTLKMSGNRALLICLSVQKGLIQDTDRSGQLWLRRTGKISVATSVGDVAPTSSDAKTKTMKIKINNIR